MLKEIAELTPSDEPAEMPTPNSWEQFLEMVSFTDTRLSTFPENFRAFYQEQAANTDLTMCSMMNEVLERVYTQYSPEVAYEICRFYLFSTVLTQCNESLDKYGNSKTHRQKEFDSNGNPFPTAKHITEVHIAGLKLGDGVDPVTSRALPGHDLYEDVSMHVPGHSEPIEKESLLEIVKVEFSQGEEISQAMAAMTKYEEIPERIQDEAEQSLLIECLREDLEAAYKREGKEQELQRLQAYHYKDILKTITSILRLRYEEYQRYCETEDRATYIKGVMRNMFTKCADISTNLPSGVSYASMLRARMMATVARVLNLDVSDTIMHHLALQSPHDALFEQLHNRPLAKQLADKGYRDQINRSTEEAIAEQSRIDVKAKAGYRISFQDEAADSHDLPVPVPQIQIEVDSEEYERLIENLPELVKNEQISSISTIENELSLEQYHGVLQKIIEVLGRRNSMWEVKNDKGNIMLYLRIIEQGKSVPYMWEHILQNDETTIVSPEEKFFAPPLDKDKAIEKFLNMQLLFYNAEYLKGKGDRIAVLIWEGGVTTCSTIAEMHELVARLGISSGEYEFVELMNEDNSIDWDNLPEYPFYYAKRKITE